MKIVVRAPVKPVWHHAHTHVGDTSFRYPGRFRQRHGFTALRTVVKAKLITDELEPLTFQNVILNAATLTHRCIMLCLLSVATVSEAGQVFISVMNLTSDRQRKRKGTRMDNVVPVSLVYQAILQRTLEQQPTKTEVNNNQFPFVHKIYEKMNYSTDSQLTSSSEFEFLSTEAGLSDRGVRKRTEPELMALIPGPESQLKEVQDLWGPAACTSHPRTF